MYCSSSNPNQWRDSSDSRIKIGIRIDSATFIRIGIGIGIGIGIATVETSPWLSPVSKIMSWGRQFYLRVWRSKEHEWTKVNLLNKYTLLTQLCRNASGIEVCKFQCSHQEFSNISITQYRHVIYHWKAFNISFSVLRSTQTCHSRPTP